MYHRSSNRKRRQQATLKPGISLVQAARYLNMDQSHLYMALQKGEIPTYKANGRTRVSQGALLDYQARKRLN